ncbi:hypothetical protein E2562_004421 [Oryza meyeriana var. granulata]|uniref:DUF7733 domain-containing protein n=1 Tax=Oryza meyeriana var. granulata TaxID=110450 RepID=A0A6G1CZA9_9ORYZ|nr:hypothetical protein E2562_004421 [Oryza meyeriana var. granulata]
MKADHSQLRRLGVFTFVHLQQHRRRAGQHLQQQQQRVLQPPLLAWTLYLRGRRRLRPPPPAATSTTAPLVVVVAAVGSEMESHAASPLYPRWPLARDTAGVPAASPYAFLLAARFFTEGLATAWLGRFSLPVQATVVVMYGARRMSAASEWLHQEMEKQDQ